MSETFQVIPRTNTVYYFTCPGCDDPKEHTFTGLVERLGPKITDKQTAGPWTCETCQSKLFVEVYRQNDGGIGLTVEKRPIPTEEQMTHGLVLLRSTNADGKDPIYLIVHDSYVNKFTTAESSKDYWYNEHTCPTNWTRNVVGMMNKCAIIMHREDTDPHGVFEYVKHYNEEEIRQICTNFSSAPPESLDHFGVQADHIHMLFPELFGTTIDGELSQQALPGVARLLTNEGI